MYISFNTSWSKVTTVQCYSETVYFQVIYNNKLLENPLWYLFNTKWNYKLTINENRRELWRLKIQNLNFTHSSEKAWNIIRQLWAALTNVEKKYSITANNVAKRLIKVANNNNNAKEDNTWNSILFINIKSGRMLKKT